jgi:hypothetical protein
VRAASRRAAAASAAASAAAPAATPATAAAAASSPTGTAPPATLVRRAMSAAVSARSGSNPPPSVRAAEMPWKMDLATCAGSATCARVDASGGVRWLQSHGEQHQRSHKYQTNYSNATQHHHSDSHCGLRAARQPRLPPHTLSIRRSPLSISGIAPGGATCSAPQMTRLVSSVTVISPLVGAGRGGTPTRTDKHTHTRTHANMHKRAHTHTHSIHSVAHTHPHTPAAPARSQQWRRKTLRACGVPNPERRRTSARAN